MDTDMFSQWFEKFSHENQGRPLLLLLDRNLKHISLSVIKMAMEEQIIIIKFQPCVTNVLQPLDVVCFDPLKGCWELPLQELVNTYGAKSNLSKHKFVNQLCKIWNSGINSTKTTDLLLLVSLHLYVKPSI